MTCPCFIIPPELLKELSRGHKLSPPDLRIFQASFLETMRLRQIREGHRLAAEVSIAVPVPPAAPLDIDEYDCRNRAHLPGRANPSDAGAPAQTVHKTTALVADFYRTVLGRNSVDNRGMDLISSLNYGRNYQNAFWNGGQMVYGNGDNHVFVDFWRSPDVIGHELTHGVTQNESALMYESEPGALNESISDCFGAAFNQWVSKIPASNDAGWLIGAGIMGPTSLAKGYTCLRDMLTPGASHCLSPQPDSYAQFDPTADVHTNSGIPNHAFCLFARGVGGNAYDSAIKLWYSACTGRHLGSNATISDFAKATLAAVDRWAGSDKMALGIALHAAWARTAVPI